MTHNILFVDDEVNVLKSIKRALIDEEYNCFFAENALDGIKIIKEEKINVVISDMRMPETDGISFLKQVESVCPQIIKIILSGQADMQQLVDLINTVDIFNFLLKPWDVEKTLKPVINKAIQQYEVITSNVEMKGQLENQLKDLEIKHFRLQKLTDSLEDSNSVIMTVANAVEAKDSVTNGHVNRVAYWSKKIGERLSFSAEEMEMLTRGAMLHDIGKIGVPDAILGKPGSLTKEEFDVMKQHTVIGEKIIKSLKSFENIKSIIRHHHEKLDGSGYPDGLTDKQIDIYTRIIAIVDIYDALISDRPYRKAMTKEEAFSILENETQKGLLDESIVILLKEEISKNANLVCMLGGKCS